MVTVSCLPVESSWLGIDLQVGGLDLAPAGMKNPLGVAIWLRAALKDEIRRRLKGMAVETGRHRPVERIIGILLIDDCRHPLERVHHLLPRDNPMMQPIGDVLA